MTRSAHLVVPGVPWAPAPSVAETVPVVPVVAEVRAAVRALLDLAAVAAEVPVLVACSGGADSLALAAATGFVAGRRGTPVHAAVVDHGLQDGSAEQAAATAALLCERLCITVRVVTVTVEGAGGLEAAARRARYAALRAARPHPDALVLLGHTLDDQAETVLLGLGRGSGSRSLAGMRLLDPPWARPLLKVRRATTRASCAALGLPVWDDPQNTQPRFTRARLRHEVLPLLEDVLAGGVAQALARTAAQLAEDGAALDDAAGALLAVARDPDPDPDPDLAVLAVEPLRAAHPAVRRRTLRGWLLAAGVRELSDAQLRAVDALVGGWHGQGGVALPGGWVACRRHGRLLVRPLAERPGGG